MEFFDAAFGRRSVRQFTGKPVKDSDLRRILDAAHAAPSAGNLQAREVVVVRAPGTRERLAEAARGQEFVAQAPVALVFCAVPGRSAARYGARGERLYCQQDVAAAVENAALAACALDLGGCWVGAFNPDMVRFALGIPEDVEPQAILAIGHPAESPEPTPRMGLASEHLEKW